MLFRSLSEAYQIKQNFEWERLRYLATMMINLKATKPSQRIQPKKLFKLPQDKKKIVKNKPLTKNELDNILADWDNTMKHGKKSKM